MSALSVKPIPTLIHYTRSFEYMMVMKQVLSFKKIKKGKI